MPAHTLPHSEERTLLNGLGNTVCRPVYMYTCICKEKIFTMTFLWFLYKPKPAYSLCTCSFHSYCIPNIIIIIIAYCVLISQATGISRCWICQNQNHSYASKSWKEGGSVTRNNDECINGAVFPLRIKGYYMYMSTL